ncbi:hypothetical protein [Brachyspira catarrhinii]|uniref:Uncharacterized protein n=1 Tax=Brachyspira catarrhinii TaxID=2528966 RepID=A0ABY2TPY6_9SPIR|nr:hypothetical protein [Brachyspira catarrhinii]TKZ34331.1 hypothetical protein EZH24_07930 [Brachyspira catarrhinii]
MAIFGIGANFDNQDVSDIFISCSFIGIGWGIESAPDLHEFIKSLKVGDIIYIKSFSPTYSNLKIKGIGLISNSEILNEETSDGNLTIGRNVLWCCKEKFELQKPNGKNNVRNNSIYEEFDPKVQTIILEKILNSNK